MIDNSIKGRGAQYNPKNKWSSVAYEFDLQEQYSKATKARRKVFVETPVNILSENKSPDIPFRYSINPYQGCEHGCVYCYARNVHNYWGFSAGLDWETKIIAKPNAPQLLERVFLRKNWKPQTIMMSGNTDPYQPLEQKMKITRKLLEVFVQYQNPVSIITKNSLIVRDLDLLKYLADRQLVKVYFSITTLDEKMRRILEPRSASSLKLLRAVSVLSESKIPVGVMMGPVIPSINDHEINSIFKAASEAGATTAGHTLVRLNGDVAMIFEDWLKRHFPDRFAKVWKKIENMHGGQVNDTRFGTRMRGQGQYASMINDMINSTKSRYFHAAPTMTLRTDLFRNGIAPSLFDE